MKMAIQRADERGSGDFGWLRTFHSFSFGRYFNPDRVHFGALRVLNDDRVAPGAGFGTHPHDNMEIVTIPLKGLLKHRDSMGHERELKPGEVQAMSAGSGVTHSEYNGSESEPVEFLQIWVMPATRNTAPKYDQKGFPADQAHNSFTLLVSPDGREGSLAIGQSAYFSRGAFDAETSMRYSLRDRANGVYFFLIDGEVRIGGEGLRHRDGAGIRDTDSFEIEFVRDSDVLLIEVPML